MLDTKFQIIIKFSIEQRIYRMHSFATSICSENNHQLFGIYFYQYTLNIKSIRKECTVRTINIIEYEFIFVLKYVLS